MAIYNKATILKRLFKVVGGTICLFIVVIMIGSLGSKGSNKSEQASKLQNNVDARSESKQAAGTSSLEVVAQVKPKLVQQVKTTDSQNKPSPAKTQPTNLVKVVSVVDGDTIKILIGGITKTIRLIGVDTPETVDPRKLVQCFGKEASNKAKSILLNKMVLLESDPTQGELDKYQRLLRYVFLEDGTFFNKMMISEGYAHEYTYNIPYKYQAEFEAAEKIAREAQLGLWNPYTCNGTTSSTLETLQTTPTQATQPTGHIFYLSTYHTSKYYYCDTDSVWKDLSPKYLKSYSSEQELLKNYPTRTLHEACK